MTFLEGKNKNKTKKKKSLSAENEKSRNDQVAHFRHRKRISVGF